MVKVDPSPSRDHTAIVPPQSCTQCLVMAKPNPCTPCFAGTCGIDTVESLENTIQRGFRNANALIDDTNRNLVIATADADCDGGVFRRIVDGVFHQILHRRFDGFMIGVDEQIILIDSVYGTLDVHQLLLAIQRKHQIDMLRFGLHLVFNDRLAYQASTESRSAFSTAAALCAFCKSIKRCTNSVNRSDSLEMRPAKYFTMPGSSAASPIVSASRENRAPEESSIRAKRSSQNRVA